MEKKLTAVDFLRIAIESKLGMTLSPSYYELFAIAKEMEEKQQGYSEEDMREAIVKSALSNIDNMIERCDKIIEQF